MISNEMDPLVVNSGAAALDLIARQSSTLEKRFFFQQISF